MVRIIVGDD